MGIFSNIKKEIYINQLVIGYTMIYNCDDYQAIGALRSNYDKDELKKILKYLKILEMKIGSEGIRRLYGSPDNPFKE